MSLAALAGIILNLILPEKRANKVEESLSTVDPPTLEESEAAPEQAEEKK